MLTYDRVAFRYDPFPLGVAARIFSEVDYEELVRSYPPAELFAPHPGVGRRLTLSYRHNASKYHAHVRRHHAWRELQRYISTAEFVDRTLRMLRDHHVDLGITRPSMANRVWLQARSLRHGRVWPWNAPLATEMIFACLPADGGSLLPHTDAPRKLINMALPMCAPGSWDAAAGGGTDVNWPKDARQRFNRTNATLDFSAVDTLDTVPFQPNQALIVIRSDISWHSIRPMTAPGSTALRRTVNINLIQPAF